MAPLPRSALPPPPSRDCSLDEPLLSHAVSRTTSPQRQQHKDRHHSEHRCNKWKRRICRVCCFWRCKPASRDHHQSPPGSEPEPRRRDPSQPRNEADLGRQTSTVRKRQTGPFETGQTTESEPQQSRATGSPTRTVRFILLFRRRCPLLVLRSPELINLRKIAFATAQSATIHRRRCGELDGCASGSRPPRHALPPRNSRTSLHDSPTSPPPHASKPYKH